MACHLGRVLLAEDGMGRSLASVVDPHLLGQNEASRFQLVMSCCREAVVEVALSCVVSCRIKVGSSAQGRTTGTGRDRIIEPLRGDRDTAMKKLENSVVIHLNIK